MAGGCGFGERIAGILNTPQALATSPPPGHTLVTAGEGARGRRPGIEGPGFRRGGRLRHDRGMTTATPGGVVAAVSSSGRHTMAKPNRSVVRLLAGLGVEGDAHCGV